MTSHGDAKHERAQTDSLVPAEVTASSTDSRRFSK